MISRQANTSVVNDSDIGNSPKPLVLIKGNTVIEETLNKMHAHNRANTTIMTLSMKTPSKKQQIYPSKKDF